MARIVNYSVNNPGYTIYHRAALGGLGATVRSWGNHQPKGVDARVTADGIVLKWGDDLSDDDAIRRILAASFKLTNDNLIELPGQSVAPDAEDLRLAIHNALTGTFLQHNKMRPAPAGEKGARAFILKSADDETGVILTYKPVGRYAHQDAQKTGLLDQTQAKKSGTRRILPLVAKIPQCCVPGAMGGATDLEALAEDALLLMFLMVACPVFTVRSRARAEKTQFCVVVPDVRDVLSFSRALSRIAARSQNTRRFTNTFLGRVVGGAEEAALRFIIDIEVEDSLSSRSVAGCVAVSMGKVAWDKNQINRSSSIRVRRSYPEIGVFHAANAHLGMSRLIKKSDGSGFAVPSSPVPELTAANLAADRHWCAHFRTLVDNKKDFLQMCYAQRGLKAMKEAVKDADDQAVIRTFHKAWEMTMGALGDRATRDGLSFEHLADRQRERMRNAILRTKTSGTLAAWFLRFCADATKGASLAPLRDESQRIRTFIFNHRNFERFQNLCLFALVSYGSDEPKTLTEGRK